MWEYLNYVFEVICALWWVIVIMAVMLTLFLFTFNVDDSEYEELNSYYKQITDEYEGPNDESNI